MMEWQVFFTLFTLHQCHQYPCNNLTKSGGLLVLSLSPLKACKNFVLQCVSMNVFSWPCLIWCGCALLVWFSAMLNKDGHVSCYRMAFLTMLMSSFPIFTDGGFLSGMLAKLWKCSAYSWKSPREVTGEKCIVLSFCQKSKMENIISIYSHTPVQNTHRQINIS